MFDTVLSSGEESLSVSHLAIGSLDCASTMRCAGARQLPRGIRHGKFTDEAKARLSNDGQRFVRHQTDSRFLR